MEVKEKFVVVFGAGGHGKVIIDILLSLGVQIAAVVDDNPHATTPFGLPLKSFESLSDLPPYGIVAVGHNFTRAKVVNRIRGMNPDFEFISAIHHKAIVGRDVKIGAGSVVMAGAVINPGARIGEHVIINTQSSIDHDTVCADFSSIAPGAILGGNVEVGSHSAVGLGAMCIHGMKIGSHTVIGAGSVVIEDIPSHTVALGVPCKIIRPRSQDERYL